MPADFIVFDDALSHARKLAQYTGAPHYAIEWPLGARTVENRKPLTRDHRTKVVEVMPDGTTRDA